MNTHTNKVVTRFAPSPTGFMHIGGVRTALFAYLWAKKNNGTFILRIEDTDKEREVPGSIEHITESLRWLGLEWEYGPDKAGPFGSCVQSERLPVYKKYAERLVAAGHAYPDTHDESAVEEFRRSAQLEKRPFLFREHRPVTMSAWDGVSTLRFKVPVIKRYAWMDAVRGELTAGEEALDDFVLIKKDGYPTYNFAHIVDDYEMGVTHVFRGDEFISSTPRFLSLYDALGFPVPQFATVPPILNEDKTKKLGKRDGAKDILEYRADGYLPDAMLNFLAFIGWNPGTEQELFTHSELIEAFTIDGIQIHGGAANDEKLLWFNREYLQKLSDSAFFDYIRAAVPQTLNSSSEVLQRLLPTIRQRTAVRTDFETDIKQGEYAWVETEPALAVDMIAWKKSNSTEAAQHLAAVETMLTAAPQNVWTSPESLKELVWPYATEHDKGSVLWPLRYVLTGKEKSPDPFTVAYIVGRDVVLKRLQAALKLICA